MTTFCRLAIWSATALLLAACAGGLKLNPERSAAMASEASGASTVPPRTAPSAGLTRPRISGADDERLVVQAAAANPARLANDKILDARRKGDEVLEFLGIRPGMTVLDLYSGGGYYSELLSYLVGVKGAVIAHNNAPYLKLAEKEIAERYAPGRLGNVERITAENNQLALTPNRFDAVLMIDAYHDIYYVDEASGWSRIDGPKLLAEIYRSLKPGGLLGVVDHVAVVGAPAETGGTLHRIDPERLKREITAQGFVFEAESDVLHNPADDHLKAVFDPSIRGHTDQAVLRFRKPK